MTQKKRKDAASVDAVAMAAAETGNRPPQAPEVEEAVIGAMMLDADSVYHAMESLTENSFYNPKLRCLFQAMERLFRARTAIDSTTVVEQLRQDGNLEEVGGPSFVASLTTQVGSGANVEYYVKILQQKTIQRDLIKAGYDIVRKGFDETCPVDQLIEDAQTEVYHAVEGNLRGSYVDIGKALNEALERLEWIQKNDGLTGVPSGFPSLDTITRGWQNGNLIVIGARPGHGKSAIALNMAKCAAVDNGIPTAIFTLEMQYIELADRLIGIETGLPSAKRKGEQKMTGEEWSQMEQALRKASKAPLYIDETPALTITEFTSKVKRMVHERGIRIVFVDYLQLMKASANLSQYRALEIGEISRQLKETAKELKIPIIALAQLNRNLISRQGGSNGRPVLSDLRESGSIEQDADMVLFIHRPPLLGLFEGDPGYSELIIAKNRAGKMDTIPLHFNEDLVCFREASESLADYAAQPPAPPAQPIPSAANTYNPTDITPTEGYVPYDFDNPQNHEQLTSLPT